MFKLLTVFLSDDFVFFGRTKDNFWSIGKSDKVLVLWNLDKTNFRNIYRLLPSFSVSHNIITISNVKGQILFLRNFKWYSSFCRETVCLLAKHCSNLIPSNDYHNFEGLLTLDYFDIDRQSIENFFQKVC